MTKNYRIKEDLLDLIIMLNNIKHWSVSLNFYEVNAGILRHVEESEIENWPDLA